jgi:hypothetical protein
MTEQIFAFVGVFREHPINKVPMTSIKLLESYFYFREVQKWVCLNLYAPLTKRDDWILLKNINKIQFFPYF